MGLRESLMSQNDPLLSSRREFLTAAGGLAVGSMLPSLEIPFVHSGSDETIQVALVGCGGRGSGAAVNAVRSKGGGVKLVAMADVFQDKMDGSVNNLSKSIKDQMDVPKERQFVGYDAYKQAMDCLKPGDVVILTTPPGFRWLHFKYAVEKKLNIFMEKPVTVDGPTSKKFLELNKAALAADLKIVVGLMSRHSVSLQELHKRVQDGQLGDIMYMRGYRMHGPAASFESTPKPANMSHLEYQIRRFHSFLWASGGAFNDFYIHHIDHLSWMKNSWPVSAHAVGGRHFKRNNERVEFVDQNFDSYSVEYTYADGSKLFFDGRCMHGARGVFQSFVHGTKGAAIAARSGDCGGPAAIFSDQNMSEDKQVWVSDDRSNPYQNEWDTLIDAIRTGKKRNETESGVYASAAASMGRMAAHTGQEITMEQFLNHDHEFAPNVAQLTVHSAAPLMPGPDGFYARPRPGQIENEY